MRTVRGAWWWFAYIPRFIHHYWHRRKSADALLRTQRRIREYL